MSNLNPAMNRRRLLGLAGAGAAGLAISSWSAFPALGQEQPSGQVVIGTSQEPTSFNPLMNGIEIDRGVHYALFDPLIGVDDQGAYFPVLATEVPTVENGGISPDGLTFTFNLRGDVVWHDGTPFTAEDVKFTLDLINEPTFRSASRVGHELVSNIEVLSPTSIKWTMKRLYAPYLSLLSYFFILPKHAFPDITKANDAPFNQSPIGTGPFKWGERVAGDHVTVMANPNYFGDGPYLGQVIYKYIPDLTVMYTLFKTGDIDFVSYQYITPDNLSDAKTLSGKIVEVLPSAQIEGIMFNYGRPQFKELAVRQAIYLAIDKQGIVDALYYGVPMPTESFVPTQSKYYASDLPAHEFNLDKARQMLDEAGWAPGPDGIRQKEGVTLAFGISTTTGNPLREQTQQFLQQTLREIGVAMSIENYPPAVMWGEKYFTADFDTVMLGGAYVNAGDLDVSSSFGSAGIPAPGGSGSNVMRYSTPEIDAAITAGASTFDVPARQKSFGELQQLIRHDLVYMPLFQYAFVGGRAAGLTGPKSNINVYIDTWNIAQWRWISV